MESTLLTRVGTNLLSHVLRQDRGSAPICHWWEACSGYVAPEPEKDANGQDIDDGTPTIVNNENPYPEPENTEVANASTDPSDPDAAPSKGGSSSKSSSSKSNDSDDEDDEDESGGGGALPATIVYPVLLSGQIFQLAIISLVGAGFQIFIWSYILLDRILDTIIRLLLGSIGPLKPLAWLAIWSFKLPTFPIIIFGWAWTIITETMAFPVSGWMLFFGGSGCFLRWGHNCKFPNGQRFGKRSYWQIADLAWLMKAPVAILPPSYSKFEQELMMVQGQERRASLVEISPLFKAYDLVSNIQEYIAM